MYGPLGEPHGEEGGAYGAQGKPYGIEGRDHGVEGKDWGILGRLVLMLGHSSPISLLSIPVPCQLLVSKGQFNSSKFADTIICDTHIYMIFLQVLDAGGHC